MCDAENFSPWNWNQKDLLSPLGSVEHNSQEVRIKVQAKLNLLHQKIELQLLYL